jgi:lipoprotein Spr
MTDARRSLSESPIKIPERFWQVRYHRGGVRGVDGGANCQQYAYEFLRAFGYRIPDFRSSNLWADTLHTVVTASPERFDLVLVHNKPDALVPM